jgi:hypothetical protein
MRVSIECTHRQLQLLKLQMDARTILVLIVIGLIWAILSSLKIV